MKGLVITVFSNFIFHASSAVSSSHLSCQVIIKFKLYFNGKKEFWMHEFSMCGFFFYGKYNSKYSVKHVNL